MLDKKEIEGIVNKSFYDCGYKKKYTKEYYEELVDNVFKDLDWDTISEKEMVVDKNHDYFSGIRGAIREITDSKEEYREYTYR